MAVFGRTCGEDAPATPGKVMYRCTLRNRHYGAHVSVVGGRTLDTWPREQDIAEAKRRNGPVSP